MRYLKIALISFVAAGCTRDDGNKAEKKNLIQVTTPRSGEAVTSPLLVRGEVRGTWFFEATFPVRLLDANGHEIAVEPAEAQGEWMTEHFVPFVAELEFTPPAPGTRGTLVLERNNPSGLSKDADELRIPILFLGGDEKKGDSLGAIRKVQVYFSNPGLARDSVVDCGAVFPVERTVPRTKAAARAALEALLIGPTPEEYAQGYSTNIPQGVSTQNLVIEDGVATADFSAELGRTGGSCRVEAIRVQIERTLQQFPTVRSVRISIDGSTEDILQP